MSWPRDVARTKGEIMILGIVVVGTIYSEVSIDRW